MVLDAVSGALQLVRPGDEARARLGLPPCLAGWAQAREALLA